jgi:hypothetical protein
LIYEGVCTKSELVGTTLFAKTGFREPSLVWTDRCTHFDEYQEDALKVTACKELTTSEDCIHRGNFFKIKLENTVCGEQTIDMDYRKISVDLSTVAGGYTAENCQAACILRDTGDCQEYHITADSCTLWPSAVSELEQDKGSCKTGGGAGTIYERVQSCYWSTPVKIHDDSGCGNQAALVMEGEEVLDFTVYTRTSGYDTQLCH